MITEHDLKEAIAECEGQRNPSVSTCVKLAAFYTIRDKMFPAEQDVGVKMPTYSYSSSSIDVKPDADTEFLRVASNMDMNELLAVMDELMDTVKAVIPKLYDGVMRRLRS